MSFFNNCPRCGGSVEKVAKTQLCKCGWTASETEDVSQKNVVLSLFLIAGLIAGLGFHTFQWGQHSVDILFAGPQQKLSICMDLKKYDCVEKAYEDLYLANKSEDVLEKMAEFQFRRGHYEASYSTYKNYFASGGNNEKAIYYYAHALAKIGQIDQSIRYFEMLTKIREGVLMVTVIESYLQVLVSNNRLNKAKEVLSWAKNIARNSSSQRHIERWQKQFKI